MALANQDSYSEATIRERLDGTRRYQGPLAERIEDLGSLATDLDNCVEALDLRLASKDLKVRHYLWQQALVLYGRCFSSGVRLTVRPTKFLKVLPESMRTRHELVMALRNRFVAHSVNRMEVSLITFRATQSGISAIETSNMRMNPDTEESPTELRELADALRKLIRASEVTLLRAVAKELNAVPLHDLLAMPTIKLEMITSRQLEADANRSRRPRRSPAGT